MVAAISFFWAGMILAISFVEAPLKFRAPGITPALGLGIGKRVFTALNRIEIAFAIIVVATAALTRRSFDWPIGMLSIVIVMLVVQTIWLLPKLVRRADAVIAGENPPRGRLHLIFIAFEAIKLILLVIAGTGELRTI